MYKIKNVLIVRYIIKCVHCIIDVFKNIRIPSFESDYVLDIIETLYTKINLRYVEICN